MTVVQYSAFVDATSNDMGWCRTCKDFTRDSCEPDACKYDCPVCGKNTVYGAEESLMQGFIEVLDEEDENDG